MPKNKPRPLKGEHQPKIIVRAAQNIGSLSHTESAARAEGSVSPLPLMRQHARKISVSVPQRDLEVREIFLQIASGRRRFILIRCSGSEANPRLLSDSSGGVNRVSADEGVWRALSRELDPHFHLQPFLANESRFLMGRASGRLRRYAGMRVDLFPRFRRNAAAKRMQI